MTVMLEVSIGLVFVYLILSLLASSIAETLEHFLRYRADYLRQGIEKLLLDGNERLRSALYEHPLIKSLYTPLVMEGRWGRGSGPSYIPSRQFALAFLDVVTNSRLWASGTPAAAPVGGAGAPEPAPTPTQAAPAAGPAPAPVTGSIATPAPSAAPAPAPAPAPGAAGAPARAAGTATAVTSAPAATQLLALIDANTALPPAVAATLRTLIRDADGDMNKVKANIQEWFDGSMDRVAGWYKRRAQLVLLVIGVFVAVGINVDTLAIINTLSNDSAVRSAVVTAAEQYAREHPQPPQPTTQKPAGAGRPDSGPAKPSTQTSDNPPRGTAAAQTAGAATTGASGTGSGAQGTGAGPQPLAGDEADRTQRSVDDVTRDVRQSVQAVSKQLGTLGLPVGWRKYDPQGADKEHATQIAALEAERIKAGMSDAEKRQVENEIRREVAPYLVENRVIADLPSHIAPHFLGWLLTAFAISFGAPFWFDTLNKIMVVRSTVKPREKSREEGSEDRRPPR